MNPMGIDDIMIKEISPMNYDAVMLCYMDLLSDMYNCKNDKNQLIKLEKCVNNINTVVLDGDYGYNFKNILINNEHNYYKIFRMFVNLEVLIINNIDFPSDYNLFLECFKNLKSLTVCNCPNIKNWRLPSRITYVKLENNNLADIPIGILLQSKLKYLYLNNNNITTISPLIQNLNNLKYVILANNKLKILPDAFSGMTQLECLSISNNPFEDFHLDKKITNCTNLIKLIANNCHITRIDKSIGNLVKLDSLDIGNNPMIVKLPKSFENLKNLNNVNLDNIGLQVFPECITICNNIERLRMSNNKMELISENIENLKNIKSLNLNNCNLGSISSKIGTLQTLKELFISQNNLIIIPQELENLNNLIYLDFSQNNLQTFPTIFTNMKHLQVLNMNDNNITSINDNIINAVNLKQIIFDDYNVLEFSENALKFIQNIMDNKNVINDVQNIHSSSVQQNLIKSIDNIKTAVTSCNVKEIIIINEIMSDNTLSTDCKFMISKNFHNNDVLNIVNMNFKQIFIIVWKYINMTFNIETQTEIKRILSNDLMESKDLCFVGKITRLIGCLNGFSNLVQITISEAEEIGIIISNISKNLVANNNYTPEKHYALALEELCKMKFKEETIQEWIQYIIA